MGWHKITKKLTKNVGKALKNPIKYNPVWKGFEAAGKGIDRNWEHIRTPLAYAGLAAATILSYGAAAGYTVPAMAGMAAAGAASGAVAGAAAGEQQIATEKAADKAAKEQERLAAEEAEQQRRLSLLKSGQTPEGISELSLEAKRRMRSQYQRNQVSRQAGKKLGGESSTLA